MVPRPCVQRLPAVRAGVVRHHATVRIGQRILTHAVHDRLGNDAAVVHLDAGATEQPVDLVVLHEFSHAGPQHGDGRTLAKGRINTGAADLETTSRQVEDWFKVKLAGGIEAPGLARLPVEQQAGQPMIRPLPLSRTSRCWQ